MTNKNKSISIESNNSFLSKEPQDIELHLENQETDKNPDSKKRKLHKTYIKGWSEDIAKNGFARCIIASCNFIASDILIMQKHHKNCNGVSCDSQNLCAKCGSNLATSEELLLHKTVCKELEKPVQNSSSAFQNSSNSGCERSKKWEHQIETLGQAFCDNQKCNFAAIKLSEMQNHSVSCIGVSNFGLFYCIHCRCEFSNKDDHLKHQRNCSIATKLSSNSKKVENLHFRVIKQMKNRSPSEDHIIQPGPDLPKGQYRRRRAYRAEHKKSWALTLEKYKYVKCIYQNCYFIAMSLEDMIAHFGYCIGDGSFAKFVCPYCNGRVTSEAVLLKHIERSHPLEHTSIKVEPLMDKDNDEFLISYSRATDAEETNLACEMSEKTPVISKIKQSSSHKIWQDQIHEFGYAFCQKSLCNFMAPDISKLEVHLKACTGTPNFKSLNCPKCRYRLPTKEDLALHVPFCKDEKVKYFSTFGSEIATFPHEGIEEDDYEIGPVFRQYEGRLPRMYSKHSKVNSTFTLNSVQSENNSCESPIPEEDSIVNHNNSITVISKISSKQKSRGRPKKNPQEAGKINEVKCGKCNFEGTKSSFAYHNLKIHVGLGWIEGEKPVDINDEKLVIRLVKEAFKLTKKGACEKCDDVKRSVMGFVSHIQNCGKSEEEKNALKVKCPHCDGKYLKYSLNSHVKFCHQNPEEEEKKSEILEESLDACGRRRSAIRAVSKFQEVLNDGEESELNHYFFYERGNERTPKLNSKLNNLWYKLKRENKKIPCRHPNCNNLSVDVKEAKNHHYNCPSLPEKVFMCELCDFYSIDEPSVQSHVTTHRKFLKQRKTSEEDEIKVDEEINEVEDYRNAENDVEEEETKSSEEEVEDSDDSKKRKKKRCNDEKTRKKLKYSNDAVKPDLDIELRLKQNFCRREKIDSVRGIQFYSNGLDMTLQEELSNLTSSETWPELCTEPQDWFHVPLQEALRYLPGLIKSVSVRFDGNEVRWRRFGRFESDLIERVPVMFTGGSVRSMSWCKISSKRMMEKTERQYLALTTAKKLDYLNDIYDRSSLEKSSLLQIWDCGALDSDCAKDPPEFSLGIIQKGGEIWDLAWFPEDTYAEGSEKTLTRLGLLATASEDGAVRVWSICDPCQLERIKGLPIYTTEPLVILIADEDFDESCLQVSVGLNGVLAGGFGNGTVAVWNLKNISTSFCRKIGKCKTIRAHLVFQAHKTAITALTFCPTNSRYISTAGLDRFVKVWDSEFPSIPIEQNNKEYSLDNIWTMNWPSLIYNFDDVVLNFNKGAVKFIKDILTDRHQSTFAMEDSCLSLSFSDWLNALCGGSITGEVKLRLLKNLIHDQKRYQSIISSICLEKLNDRESKESCSSIREAIYEVDNDKNFPRTYDEVDLRFGLVFKDNLGIDKGKPEKPEAHPEEFPIRAVNKIAFNPNFMSFTHIALGYNCGLVRILPLKELQSAKSLKLFLEKAQKKKF